jgi:signal transduction histidine kinase
MKAVEALHDVLQAVQSALFIGLAAIALYRWVTRRGAARAWLAGTFGVLGAVVVAGLLLPTDPDDVAPWVISAVLALLVLFPYFLFRFGGTFRPRARLVEAGALALTVGLAVSAFLLGDLPGPDEPMPPRFAAWVGVFLVQWVVLSLVVAVELWRAGKGQPTVSRRRMRVLSIGSIGLALSLVVSAGVGSDEEEDAGVGRIVTDVLGLASAPLFLLGFAPPQFVLASWRRDELDDLRAAEEVLLAAQSPAEVGEGLVPHVTRIIGGQSAALFGDDGGVLGVDGTTVEEAKRFFGDPANDHEVITLPVRAGRLVVRVSPYTPYFARSEAELLSRLATFTDLALSRAELSERERETARELQVANEAMREFLAIASHDLRTPVTVIKGFASTLEQDWDQVPEPQRVQYLAAVRRHADHLGVIIDDLLTTSRLDAGVLEPNPSEVALGPFLERLVEDLPGLTVDDVRADAGLVAWVDEEHLQRMVTNYLVNAFRYGAPPVTVSASRRNGCAEILVRDAGEGVPGDFEPRVFEKFARADKRNSRENQGTGLGLAIVRGLARAAGGEAWYERNEPQGACFGLRLPVSPPR